MNLRPRRAEDVAQCVEIMRLTHLDSGYPIYWPDDPTGFLSDDAESLAWVAVNPADQIVGHVALHQAEGDLAFGAVQASGPAEAKDFVVVARLLVHPDSQGLGVGKLLLDTAVTQARKLSQHPILDVVETANHAIGFYESLGWKQVGPATVDLIDRPSIHLLVYTAPTFGLGEPVKTG